MISSYALNEVYTGDARELIKALSVDGIDEIITDPPYNIGFDKYGGYDDNLPDDEYIAMLAELKRFKKVVISHYPEETMRYIVPALGAPDHVSAWCYNSNIPRRFRLVNYYGVVPDYTRIRQSYKNPDDERINRLIQNGSQGSPLYEWWSDIQIVKNVSKGSGSHPCPMPLKLMERIVVLTTQPGEVVLDPFCGSGTTGEACIRLGRHFVGFEIDPATAELARVRIADTQPPLFVLDAASAQMTLEAVTE